MVCAKPEMTGTHTFATWKLMGLPHALREPIDPGERNR